MPKVFVEGEMIGEFPDRTGVWTELDKARQPLRTWVINTDGLNSWTGERRVELGGSALAERGLVDPDGTTVFESVDDSGVAEQLIKVREEIQSLRLELNDPVMVSDGKGNMVPNPVWMT